jgi:hypothetical protein
MIMSPAALFELIDKTGGPPPPGPWRLAPGGPEGLAFGAAEATSPDPVWRADLPGERGLALAALAAAEAELRRQDAVIVAAPGRMVAVAAPTGVVSYSVAGQPAPELRAPDLWLRATIDGLRGTTAPAEAASYGLRDDAAAAWQEAEGRFQAFVAQVRDAVSGFAVVETRVAGVLVARTRVSWTGDFHSLLGGAPFYRDAGLHRRTVGLALGSRAALLKTFGTVMRGAAIVAALTSSPVGAALALPAAWRFVEQLRDELQT